jgi:hypothetical protein
MVENKLAETTQDGAKKYTIEELLGLPLENKGSLTGGGIRV